MIRADIDTADIQALAHSGFGTLKGAVYLLLRVVDPALARRWLGDLHLACVADLPSGGGTRPLAQVVQVAVTAAGLRALGVPDAVVAGFAPEFVEGMAGNANRSGRLGDSGANAPETWDWGTGAREPHVLVMLFASPATLEALRTQVQAQAEAGGLMVMAVLPTTDMAGVEPFGFADGVSQPVFDWDSERIPGLAADRDYTNLLTLGEVVLGYRNEYDAPASSPTVPETQGAGLLAASRWLPGQADLGRNGSYLVHRQLAQDVRGFWRWVAQEAARAGLAPQALAEAMVGRKMDGAPLADLISGRDLPGTPARSLDDNGFLFDSDPDGLSCPIGAHIRRSNPRTGDLPVQAEGAIDRLLVRLGLTMQRQRRPVSAREGWPMNTTVWPRLRSDDDAIASSRFHRILRRGREYGARIDPELAMDPATPDPEAGLHFICLNASIARQFEFVQGAWIASSTFAGLSGEQDPLLGNRIAFPDAAIAPPQPTDGFTRPAAAAQCRHSTGLPQFIRVVGGAYFFLPGLAALRWIAAL